VAIAVLSLLGFAHWAIYKAVILFFNITGANVIAALRVAFMLLGFSFIVMPTLTVRGYNVFGGWLHAGSAVWFGTVWWLFWASLLGFACFAALESLGLSELPLWSGKILLLIGLLVSAYGVYHSIARVGTHVLNNALEEVDGLQIVGVSYSNTTTEEKNAKVLASLNINKSKS